jgi:hypothetical protein
VGELFTVRLPLGIFRNGTQLDSQGCYYASDLVRDADDTVRPILGWRTKFSGISGKARSIFLWKDNDGDANGAIGTHTRLYAFDRGGTAYDITPVRATASLTDPFTTTDGSAVIAVADTAHGAITGDEVTFSGATAVGGVTISGTYTLTRTSDDAYTITHTSAATSSAGPGGGTVTTNYKISPGNADSTLVGGYGNGLYGAGTYGTPRPDTATPTDIRVWTLKTWGQYLIACPNGGIYQWTLNTASAAALLTNAPTARAVHVAASRHVMALGADGNPRNVAWSDRDDNTDWTPSATDQAGDIDLQTSGRLMCGVSIPGGELLLTDTDAHLMTFIGGVLVFSLEKIGEGCGIVSQGAVAAITGDAIPANAVWMSSRSFWQCKGSGVAPLDCDVSDYVFSDINRTQIQKVTCFHNTEWGEVWWWYPSGSSTEIDRYVSWNYKTNRWFISDPSTVLTRLCATERGPLLYPLAIDSSGVCHEHEVGYDYDGAEPYIESGPIRMGEGDRVFTSLAIIPDEKTLGDVDVTIYCKDRPNSTSETTKGPYTLTARKAVRFTSRYIRVRYTGARLGDWRVGGGFQFEIAAGGLR